jgi:hypothetical protein
MDKQLLFSQSQQQDHEAVIRTQANEKLSETCATETLSHIS